MKNFLFCFADINCEVDVDYYGYDIGISPIMKINSWKDCAKHCHKNNDCKFWTHQDSNNRCWLKTGNDERRILKGAISGTKNCGGNECRGFPFFDMIL